MKHIKTNQLFNKTLVCLRETLSKLSADLTNLSTSATLQQY